MPSGDAVLIPKEKSVSSELLNQAVYALCFKGRNIQIPVGPFILGGEINYSRYRINFSLPVNIACEDAIESLKRICKVVEVTMQNSILYEEKIESVNFIPESKYVVYAQFKSLEEALDLTDVLVIEEDSIWLNHAGTMECNKCHKIGHLGSNHDKIMDLRQRKKKIKQSKKTRKMMGKEGDIRLTDYPDYLCSNKYDSRNLNISDDTHFLTHRSDNQPFFLNSDEISFLNQGSEIDTPLFLEKSRESVITKEPVNAFKYEHRIFKTFNKPPCELLIKFKVVNTNAKADSTPLPIKKKVIIAELQLNLEGSLNKPFLDLNKAKEENKMQPINPFIRDWHTRTKFENPFIQQSEKISFDIVQKPECMIELIEDKRKYVHNLVDNGWKTITHTVLRKNYIFPPEIEEIKIPNPKRICRTQIKQIFGFINILGISKDDLSKRQLRNIMIENDITVLGIAETWLKDRIYIEGFVWIGNNGPIAGYRGSGGTGLLIHKSLANEITYIETNTHRVTAVTIENILVLSVYAPVVANHQNDKSINEYMDCIMKIQEIIQENKNETTQCVILGDFNAHIKGYLSDINDLPGEIFIKFVKDNGFHILNETDISTFRGNNKHTIIDYIISDNVSKIKYKEAYQLNTNHILLLSHIETLQLAVKQKLVIPWYKLEDKELEAFQHRLYINFQNSGIYETNNPSVIFNNIKSAIEEESKYLQEHLKPNNFKTHEMNILLSRINDSRKWIKHCWMQNNKELANKLQNVKKMWINKLKTLSRYERISEKRLKECIHDPYGVWNKIKRLVNKNKNFISMNKNEINNWIKEFEDQFKSEVWFIPQKGCEENELWDLQEIQNVIKTLPNRKAPGPDNITNEIIKKGGDVMTEVIAYFLNCCRVNGIPNIANEAKTILIYKGKGNPKELKNYRPITLMNNIMKILDRAELRRIEDKVEISDRQHGFRKGKSCITQIFLLKCTIEYRRYYKRGKGKDSYILFIDFSKAYDSVNRVKLMEKIKNKKIRDDSWKSISQMIKGEQTTLVINGIETEKLNIAKGVRQGSAISPLLFNIYIDDIERVCRNKDIELAPNHRLKSKSNFQYADDTAFIVESSNDIKNILNKLDKWSKDNDMTLNIGPEKTAIMPIITKNREKIIKELPKFFYNNIEIPIIEKYKYLGKIIKGNIRGAGFDNAHYAYLRDKARVTTFSLIPIIRRMLNIPSKTLINCFKAIFLPRCTYGLEICSRNRCKSVIKEIQRAFNRIIRECCHVYDKTPIEPILLDLNIPTIEQYISLIFLQKIYDLTFFSETAMHFLKNINEAKTPTQKLYQELLLKYDLAKPYELANNVHEMKWIDQNWKENVKNKLRIFWRNKNMEIIDKKITLKEFRKFKSTTFDSGENTMFWKLNKNLRVETRVKAAWRYWPEFW